MGGDQFEERVDVLLDSAVDALNASKGGKVSGSGTALQGFGLQVHPIVAGVYLGLGFVVGFSYLALRGKCSAWQAWQVRA